ncbi:unnamed protein product, partial [Candidula unifasciata]
RRRPKSGRYDNATTFGRLGVAAELSYSMEYARRRTENIVRELWYFVHDQLKDLNKKIAAEKEMNNNNNDDTAQRALADALTMLREADHSEKARKQMSRELGSLVRRWLDFIQNPKNCRNAQRVACAIKPCGFGCNFHHYVYCLITAYATNRTLLIITPPSWATLLQPASSTCSLTDPKPPALSAETADGHFSPLLNESSHANLSDYQEMSQVEMLPFIDELDEESREHVPLSVPKDLADKLATFHGNPAAWWVGQVASYLFQPTSLLMTPIVGVHVRRTDKLLSEASYHSLEEYMLHVKDYYDQLERSQPVATRRVFLATDDPTLLPEAEEKYPNYSFLSEANASKVPVDERELENSVRGIATDIFFLSRTDFLVCTFSSQVCRLAYELMQTQHGDASAKFRSLDDIYYFGGQLNHQMVAVESYQAYWEDTISLEKGDTILVAGNHWNGFSRGFNERTSQEGLYPSYAVEDTVASYPMPLYSNVH